MIIFCQSRIEGNKKNSRAQLEANIFTALSLSLSLSNVKTYHKHADNAEAAMYIYLGR